MITTKNDGTPQKECPCISVGFAEAAVGVKSLAVKSSSNVEILDFGEVLPGRETFRCIDLKNNLDQPVSYYIHRISYVNEIYQSFHFNKYNVTINPRSTLQLKITYSPLLENEKSSDLFLLSTRESTVGERLRLVGTCLGTKIKCSTKNLHFMLTPSVKKRVNTFELKNVSKVPATFQFDVNENEELFQVDIVNGQIQPRRSIYITVTFTGKVEGIHYKRLVILIYKHDPIMMDLLGVYSRSKNYRDHLPSLTMYPSEIESMFGSYFGDYGFSEEKILPFEFNQNCIDFGRKLPQSYGKNQNNNVAVAILKNNMLHDISIKWYKDPDNIFSVLPQELIVKADEAGYFEMTFEPDFRDRMYCRKMAAQIHWRDTPRPNTPIGVSSSDLDGDEHVPLEANIILIGNSFPENQSWISAVEIIPSKIIFPVCIPGYQSYATFMLKSDGHLPVLFKFIPPRKSSITVKPLMGLMRFTKLLVARLETQATSTLYKEEWRIEINGEPQKRCRINFLGQSDVPSVIIGTDNTITFNTTLPGCQDIASVPVKNTSCFHLRLDLIENDEYFHVKPSYLELYPNEQLDTEWTFNAKLDVPHQTQIHCEMRVISNLEEIVGLPFDVNVKINAQCEYSQICATPRYQDFGNIPWGETRNVTFKIFNFGKSSVAYTLRTLTVSGNQDEIRISNVMGTLNPNENTPVEVYFTTQTTGEHVVQIVYYTRINGFGETLTSNHPVDLFSMKYSCIHPALQIEECVEHTLGKLFSKLDMWNFFAVDKINEELTDVREGETRIINLPLPTIPCHEKEYQIRFVVRNITKFDLTASLSRVKMCECRATEVSKSLSFRQKVFKCPHRSMLSMRLSNETVYGLSFQFLDIFMNFNLITTEEVAYDLKMGKDRHIKFCFQMNNIPPDIHKLSIYNNQKHKKFLNMFIGAREPPYQSVWFYNCTSQETYFEVIDSELEALNANEGFPVISCLNNKGIVPPCSSQAIFFRFHPIEAKKYQVTLPLILGSERTSIKFTGRGTYKYDPNLIQSFNNTLPTMSFHTGHFPITLSADFIVAEPFSVWNSMEKMIYMRNVTKDRVMEYTWKRSFLEGIIEVNAEPPSGTIEPEEVVAILLKFKSFEIPAISTINMSCKIVDFTQNDIHLKSVEKHQERQKQIDEYFMIDDKGTHTVKNDYNIEPASEETFITIAITFQTISSIELSQYLDIEQFFYRNPRECFETNVDNLEKSLHKTEDGVTVDKQKPDFTFNPAISQIMECMIMETLRSPSFQEIVNCQQKAIPPYYIQFKQDGEKNKAKSRKAKMREMNKFFPKSPTKDISDTLRLLLKDNLQQIFF